MKMPQLGLVSLVLATLGPSSAWAHPGHGATDPSGPLHHLAESPHLVAWLGPIAIGLALLVCVASWRSPRA